MTTKNRREVNKKTKTVLIYKLRKVNLLESSPIVSRRTESEESVENGGKLQRKSELNAQKAARKEY